MLIDSLLLLADAQAFSATGFSTNTIDLGLLTPAQRDIFVGEQVGVVVTVDVAADATTGDETYRFDFVQSANANLSSPDILAQIAIPRATLVAGHSFFLPVPWGQLTKRYIGMQLTLGGTTPSITVTMFLQPLAMASLARPTHYPDAVTIS